jgi:hypothetical protein
MIAGIVYYAIISGESAVGAGFVTGMGIMILDPVSATLGAVIANSGSPNVWVDLRARLALIGAVVSLALTGLMTLLLLSSGHSIVIVVPALVGAIVALTIPNRLTLIAAALLTAGTAVVSIVYGIGLLYLPSVAILAWAAISSAHNAARQGAEGRPPG